MRYVRLLGLVTIVAIAAMALTATASATTLTSPQGTLYTGKLVAQGTEITVHGVATYTCSESVAEGEIEQHGSSVTASGPLTKWSLGACNTHVTVLQLGTVMLHSAEGSPGNATVTVSGTRVTSEVTSMGISCIYETNETDLGILTGTETTGGNAKLSIASPTVNRTGHSIFCGSSGELTGQYVVTTPSTLYID